MPTYDYKCTACGHQFEQYQSIKAEPLTECPACGGEVKRQIGSGGGFIFKGSGFYITDYRSAGYQAAAKADAPAPAGGCGKPACGQGTCAGGADGAKPAAASSASSGSTGASAPASTKTPAA